MFRRTRTAIETRARNSGFFVKGRCPVSALGVRPLTSPTSSASGFRFVKREMRIVATKQMTQAHHARQKFTAMSLATGERVRTVLSNQLNFAARKRRNDDPIPANRPQNAPAGVIQTTNIPRSIVANRGAFTQEKIA